LAAKEYPTGLIWIIEPGMPDQPVPDALIEEPKGPFYPMHLAVLPPEKINALPLYPTSIATPTAAPIEAQ
jgi:hypothetical protein